LNCTLAHQLVNISSTLTPSNKQAILVVSKRTLLCNKQVPTWLEEKVMNFYLFIATVSLAFQLGVLVLLLVGFGFKQRLRFRLHGIFMLTAVTLHLILIGSIMVPSFVAIYIEKAPTLTILFAPFHAATGTATAILGIWIVGGWRLRPSTKFCAPKRKFMRATFILWIVTISLGVIFYFILNWSFLFG